MQLISLGSFVYLHNGNTIFYVSHTLMGIKNDKISENSLPVVKHFPNKTFKKFYNK